MNTNAQNISTSIHGGSLIAAVGLTLSGIGAGLALAYPTVVSPHWANKHQGDHLKPASRTPSLNITQRLTLWERSYRLGAAVVPTSMAASVLTWTALYLSNEKNYFGFKGLRINWHLLTAAAVAQASLIPVTLILIKPVNDRLITLRKKANEGNAVPEAEVESLFAKWQSLHVIRIVAAVGGMATASLSFLS